MSQGTGAFIIYCSLGLSILLQELALRLRGRELSAWWVSNGRDVANGAAVGILLMAIRLLGASWPIALLLGATITLILSASGRALFERIEHPWVVVAFVGFALAFPLAVAPAEVMEWAEGVVAWLHGKPA